MCIPQIDQMVRFIKQEAEEKANEIAVSAEEVCRALICMSSKQMLKSSHTRRAAACDVSCPKSTCPTATPVTQIVHALFPKMHFLNI